MPRTASWLEPADADHRRRRIDGQTDLNPPYLADAAGANQLTRKTELGCGALLTAHLHDAVRCAIDYRVPWRQTVAPARSTEAASAPPINI